MDCYSFLREGVGNQLILQKRDATSSRVHTHAAQMKISNQWNRFASKSTFELDPTDRLAHVCHDKGTYKGTVPLFGEKVPD